MTTANSNRELARCLGKSEAAVRKWKKDDRWPFGNAGPWDVDAVAKWAERTLGLDPAAASRPKAKPVAKPAVKPKRAPADPEPEGEDEDADPGTPGEGGGEGEELTEERRVNIELKRERKKKLQFEREVAQGKYLLKADVLHAWVGLAHELKTDLLNLPEAVVPAMQGLSEPEQRDVLRGRITEILRRLAREPAGADANP